MSKPSNSLLRLPSDGARVDSFPDTTVDYSTQSPKFSSLSDGFRFVCQDHACGSVPSTYFSRTGQDSQRFCCITPFAFQDKNGFWEPYGFYTQIGNITQSIQRTPSTISDTSNAEGSNTFRVFAKVQIKTKWFIRAESLPPLRACPNSCREFYERTVPFIHGDQIPTSLVPVSPLMASPTPSNISDANSYCRPIDDSISRVISRVPRFDVNQRLQGFDVVEYCLGDFNQYDIDSHYYISVAEEDQPQLYEAFVVPQKFFFMDIENLCGYSTTKIPNFSHEISQCNTEAPHSSFTYSSRHKEPDFKNPIQFKNKCSETRPKYRHISPKVLNPSRSFSGSSKSEFTCDVCKEFFRTFKILKSHKKTHEEDRKRYNCKVVGCIKDFSRRNDVKKHMKKVHKISQ
ncbi:hypothetical protein FBU30_005228 [Linnemannia zychae]|nr:hypothetical protein FBU30_005228 [Linnemannia zychae]